MKTNWTSETPFREVTETIARCNDAYIASILWVGSKGIFDVVLKTTTLAYNDTARGQGHTLIEALESALTRLKQNTTRP